MRPLSSGRDKDERRQRRGERRLRAGTGDEQLLCSFCGKSQQQVAKLIAGPGVYICDECIDLCLEILADEAVVPEPVGLDRIPDLLDSIKRNQELLAAHQNELAGLIEGIRAEIEVERLKREEPSA